MPAKKGIKKVVKKKNVKKSIRSKIKKHAEPNSNEMSLNPSLINPSLPNQATNASQLHGPNSLRAQLLARAAFAPSLGFTPQQYGNITNEKRIDQLRTDNQTINSQIANDRATIETLKSEKARLQTEIDEIKNQTQQAEKQTKETKKEIKEKIRKRDKAKHNLEMAQDDLHESQRVDMETMRQQQRVQNLQLQKAEQIRQNNIIAYKAQGDQLETEVYGLKMANQQLQSQYDENKAFQRINQLKDELKLLQNENASLQKVIDDPSFANPNEKLIELQQDIMKEQYQKDLNEKLIQKQMELNDLKIKSQTIPANELEAYTKQHAENIMKLENEKLDIEEQMRPNQQKINKYQYMLDKEDELDRKVIDVKNENERLQAQITKLDAQNNTNKLSETLKKRLTTIGQQEITNQHKKRRVELAEQTRILREQEFLDGVKVDELKKGIPKELKDDITSNATLELKNKEAKKNLDVLEQLRVNEEEEIKSKAKNDFYKTKDYEQMFQERVDKEIKTAQIQKRIEENDLFNKTQKKMQEIEITNRIQTATAEGHLSDAQQVSYIIENHVEPLFNARGEKIRIRNEIDNLIKSHEDEWRKFAEQNSLIPVILENYLNASTEELKVILTGFIQWIGTPSIDKSQQQVEENDE